MLGVLAITAASFVQGAADPLESPISLPNHHQLYSIYPIRSHITTEWICRVGEKASRVVITVSDVGDGVRNETYKSELAEIALGGRTSAVDLKAQISAAIGELTTVPDVKGKCLGQSPVLIIEGFTKQGTEHLGRTFEFKLKQ